MLDCDVPIVSEKNIQFGFMMHDEAESTKSETLYNLVLSI